MSRTHRTAVTVAALLSLAGAAIAAPTVNLTVAPEGRVSLSSVSGMNELRLLDGRVLRTTSAAIENVKVVEFAGKGAQSITWTEVGADGVRVNAFSVTADGTNYRTVVNPSFELGLRYGSFDPVSATPTLPQSLAAGRNASNAYIVQFTTQPLGAYLEEIEALGGKTTSYVASYAYTATIPASALEAVRALPFVRFVGAYEPAYRIDTDILARHFGDNRGYVACEWYMEQDGVGAEPMNILVTGTDLSIKTALAEKIVAMGGTLIGQPSPVGHLLQASLTPEQILEVAAADETLWIDPITPMGVDMNIGRLLGGADVLTTTLGYNGEGVRAEVADTGLRQTHVDLTGAIMHNSAGVDSHGTATYGQNFGRGTANPSGKGLLPAGQGIFLASSEILGGTPVRYTRTQELVNPAGIYRAVFQTNSTGNTQITTYSNISQQMDTIIFDLDIMIFQSQSNTNNQTSRPQAWAKNIVSVGGINHFNDTNYANDNWNGASIGPAADGRVKPDLAFFYDNILTTTSSSDTAYTTSFGGTSGATPMTAGFCGLFHQMWHNGLFGNATGASVFESRPHFTTMKALMINTARQWAFSGSAHNLSRNKQGYGHADVANAYNLRNKMFIVNEADVLTQGQNKTYTINVAAGEPALKVTMTYADPAPNPINQTQHRVNNLDLQVVSPSGATYNGNWGLGRYTSGSTGSGEGSFDMWSSTGGTADAKNTVENVFVQNPEAGAWTVRVTAAEINAPGRNEAPGVMEADFALVVSGGVGSCPGDVTGDRIVNFADLNVVLSQFGQVGVGLQGDVNGDGVVNFGDLNIILSNFGLVC